MVVVGDGIVVEDDGMVVVVDDGIVVVVEPGIVVVGAGEEPENK